MPLVRFISFDGIQEDVQVAAGTSLMHAAVDNGIAGILADCGGACSCATCHCYIDEAWWEKTGKPKDMEAEMLEFVLEQRPNSRLSCQIEITDELDGLVVRLPASQS